MGGLFVRCGVVFLALLAEMGTGAWMRVAGKPYVTLPFTIHKIVAVVLVVYLIVSAVRANKAAALSGLAWGFLVAAMAVLLCSGVTGSWMAIAEAYPKILPIIHQVLAYLAAPLAATALWFSYNH